MKYFYIILIFTTLSLFSVEPIKEKKSYTEIIATDPLIDKGLSPFVGKKLKLWVDDKKEVNLGDEQLTLPQIYQHALENNSELKKINTEVNKAKIALMGAKALYFPKIDFKATMIWFVNPMDPVSIKKGDLGTVEIGNNIDISFPTQDYTVYNAADKSFYNFNFSLEQPLFTWGKIPSAVEAYKKVIIAAELQKEKKEREIQAKALGYYLALFYLNRIGDIIEKQNAFSARLVFLARTSYETGFLILTDYKDVEVKVQDIVIAKHKVTEQKSQIEYSLSQLIGFDVKLKNIDFTNVSKIEEKFTFKDLDYYLQKGFSDSVEIQLLKQQVAIYECKYNIAKGDSYLKPFIGLKIDAGFSGRSFPFLEKGWLTSGAPNLMAAIQISSRIFDVGDRLATIMSEKESLENARYQLESGEDSIRQMISSTFSKIDLNYNNIDYYNLHEQNFKRHTETSEKKFKAGQIRELDNIRSQLEYHTSLTKSLLEKIDLVVNFSTLLYLTDELEALIE